MGPLFCCNSIFVVSRYFILGLLISYSNGCFACVPIPLVFMFYILSICLSTLLVIRLCINIYNQRWWIFTPPRQESGVLRQVCLCVSVYLSVYPRAYLWNRWTDLHKIFAQIPCGRGSALLLVALRYVMYFRFMDDVTFGRNGRDAETWRLHLAATAMSGVAIPGRSLMSMNICSFL